VAAQDFEGGIDGDPALGGQDPGVPSSSSAERGSGRMVTMGTVSVTDAARQSLGPVGAYLPIPFTSAPPIGLQREAAVRLERAGYRTAWTNETVGGKDPLVQLALLLGATGQLTFGTGIANIWARAPQTAHAAAAQLAEAYPGRVVLGLGVGYPQQAAAVGREFGSPLAAMRGYLEAMTAPTMTPAPAASYPRIVAANGPKMIALAAELADGVLPAGMPPAFTARLRETLGPGKLLVAAVSVITDTADGETARARARSAAQGSLARPWYAATIASLGYTDQEIAAPADDLVGAIVAHGGPDAIAAAVAAHRAAGADHVILLPSSSATDVDLMTGIEQLERLAPAVLAAG
jgi:probable F420-dependent oxidoreductase